MTSTREKLAAVLEEEGLNYMALLAMRGVYDDFTSKSLTPIGDLVNALEAQGREDLAHRAKQGEWDATREEAEAYFHSDEGRADLENLERTRPYEGKVR